MCTVYFNQIISRWKLRKNSLLQEKYYFYSDDRDMVESRTMAFSTYHNTITYVFNNIDCKKC